MTAYKMFKKLGYKRWKTTSSIDYIKPNALTATTAIRIQFDTASKGISISEMYVCIETIRAINQQCKELGWIND